MKSPPTIAIGDGGNELGMGHRDIHRAIIDNIDEGSTIACVVLPTLWWYQVCRTGVHTH
jgi:hypothetical protein